MKFNFNKPQAIAFIQGNNTEFSPRGIIKFYQKHSCVLVVADINRLPYTATGFFGFHIHSGTSCTGDGFADAGSHYNPAENPHPAHAGDLPPLMLCGNKAHLSVLTDRFRVSDIIGRTVIIHSMPDDFTTQPAGNAGERSACGIITRRWA